MPKEKKNTSEADLKLSKEVRDTLKLLKIVMSATSYDTVISNLIAHYKNTKILRKNNAELDKLKTELKIKSLDELIKILIDSYRKSLTDLT